MFGTDKSIAVQDPSYPVYVDTTVMMGNTGGHNGTGFDGIAYMVCTPENNFFPDLDKVGARGVWLLVSATDAPD
jgi:LL-diaminopimelate aminotransferase